ncbi:hypothetical protein SAMN05444682_115162 [Parapedobacter indicus]|uniref:Uncharacterized protein n=1 Tax=Parapedobacter indicus TaxID=1477437 RepID=A0A1I3V3C8_9SPHI|nr:hypothetical protein CLV26_11515 [Parapedobacter indicus]SFJ89489.1 hypothetical protein SAMN05444682_115162 [Parapedobacter indicus]
MGNVIVIDKATTVEFVSQGKLPRKLKKKLKKQGLPVIKFEGQIEGFTK